MRREICCLPIGLHIFMFETLFLQSLSITTKTYFDLNLAKTLRIYIHTINT